MSLGKHMCSSLMPSRSHLPDVSPLLPKIVLGLLLLPAQGNTCARKSSSLVKAPCDRALQGAVFVQTCCSRFLKCQSIPNSSLPEGGGLPKSKEQREDGTVGHSACNLQFTFCISE